MLLQTLRELRIKNGYTQESIAEKLNVQKRTYGSWERGERNIPYDVLVQIADMYEISLDNLLGRDATNYTNDQEKTSEIQQQNKYNGPQIYDIVTRLHRLSPQKVDFIMKAIDLVEKGEEI